MTTRERADVLIVGGGPAGLAAATRLAEGGKRRVLILEREAAPGGVARYSAHHGYGLDVRRPLTGPQYAEYRARAAHRAGVEIRTRTSAIDWADSRTVVTTGPTGMREIAADAVVLATGCRERPRMARLIPGSRPAGVFTTGSLQQTIHLYDQPVGTRAVIVGAEHVSYAALLSLRHARVAVAAMVTAHPGHQTYPALAAFAVSVARVPLLTKTTVVALRGSPRLEGVDLADLVTGATRMIDCDSVVFTGEFVPDNELSRRHGLDIDSSTHGPAVDFGFRTSAPGIFAIGNVLRGAETADHVAREGTSLVTSVVDWLSTSVWPSNAAAVDARGITLSVAPPLQWICPNRIWAPSVANRLDGRLLHLRADGFVSQNRIVVRQGDHTLWAGAPTGRAVRAVAGRALYCRRGGLIANRTYRIPGDWLSSVQAELGDVTVALEG